MVLATGATIDNKYIIKGVLGAGGYGIVYEATQTGLDRPIALKLLAESIDEENVARLMREAQALSTMNHRNLIQCFGYGTYNGAPYIAVEYVPGASLQNELKSQQPLPCTHVLDLFTQICEGLASAHSHGIVHRDLKPANILITPGPNGKELVKIIDFGLAKILPEAGINAKQQQLTDMGVAIGTVSYMSPEQCIGHPADARSDIYAVGCMLYECLTGRRPFESDAAVAIMFKQLNEPVPQLQPAQRNRATEQLQNILERALAKESSQRYQSAAELAADLQAVAKEKELYQHSESAQPLQPSVAPNAVASTGTNKMKWIVLPVAITAALFVVASVFMHQGNKADVALRNGDSAMSAGDYEAACGHYRAAVQNTSDIEVRLLGQTRLLEAYCASGKASDFLQEADALRDANKNKAYDIARADFASYSKIKNQKLMDAACAAYLACSPNYDLSGATYISQVCQFSLRAVSTNDPVFIDVVDKIDTLAEAYALQQAAERPDDLAAISATHCMLAMLHGGDFTAAASTTSNMLTSLGSLSLSPERRRAYEFCKNLYEFNFDDPRALDKKIAIRWMAPIAWLCQRMAVSGEFTKSQQMCDRMAAWSRANGAPYAEVFALIPSKSGRFLLAKNGIENSLSLEALSELPAEPMHRAYVISVALQRASKLAQEKNVDESLAYFNAALDACMRIRKIDLISDYALIPQQCADASVEFEPAFAAIDKYYGACAQFPEDAMHHAAVGALRADVAFKLLQDNYSPANLKRALACSDEDMRNALATKSAVEIANSNFRNARIWALAGNAERLREPWEKAFDYYSRNKKADVHRLMLSLADLAYARNPRLHQQLRDDAWCIVDGKIAHPTPADLEKLPAPGKEREELVTRLVPEGDRLLEAHEFDKFIALKKAVVDAGYRAKDCKLVASMVQLSPTAINMGQLELGAELLEIGEAFAKTHLVDGKYEFVQKLARAECYRAKEPLTAKDRGTARAQKMEALYLDDLEAALAMPPDQLKNPLIADARFRLARVYATIGDTEHFLPIWNDCAKYYAHFADKSLLPLRVDEMSKELAKHGGLPKLAEQIRTDAVVAETK